MALRTISIACMAAMAIAGCTDERRYVGEGGVYQVALTADTPAAFTAGEDSIYIVEQRVELPIRVPSQTQLDDLQKGAARYSKLPFPRLPWVGRSDLAIEVDFTLSNLDRRAQQVTVIVNGIRRVLRVRTRREHRRRQCDSRLRAVGAPVLGEAEAAPDAHDSRGGDGRGCRRPRHGRERRPEFERGRVLRKQVVHRSAQQAVRAQAWFPACAASASACARPTPGAGCSRRACACATRMTGSPTKAPCKRSRSCRSSSCPSSKKTCDRNDARPRARRHRPDRIAACGAAGARTARGERGPGSDAARRRTPAARGARHHT